MPLTAYSKTHPGEHDVEQILGRMAGLGIPLKPTEEIPGHWRDFLRTDLECPICFASGAEIVRSVGRGGKSKQTYFRFTDPGHRELCDFDDPEMAGKIPDNLVLLTSDRSKLTRVVRQLVCSGISLGVFDQVAIRNMRQWFFEKKVTARFKVTVNPHTFDWLNELGKLRFYASLGLPSGVDLNTEVASVPGFEWYMEASRRLVQRYAYQLGKLEGLRTGGIFETNDPWKRAEALAKRYQDRSVFDPSALAEEYSQTAHMAKFIAHNYAPLKGGKGNENEACVRAFSALLLCVHQWNTGTAISSFARIVSAIGDANQTLGNVMGLNPFHDFGGWRVLKAVQDADIPLPVNTDLRKERKDIEAALREEFDVSRIG